MGKSGRSRTVTTGSLAATALVWAWWITDPTAPDAATQPMALTALLSANVVVTILVPQLKQATVASIQRWVVNPIVRALFRIGVVPFGFALLETRGRRSGEPRRTPVSNGLVGSTFWLVAEHGADAQYVRNLIADPQVRVKLRRGFRFVWLDGVATVLPEDDPVRRQRSVCRWRPLRWFNAITVRTLGTDLLTIRVEIETHLGTPPEPVKAHAGAHAEEHPRNGSLVPGHLRGVSGDLAGGAVPGRRSQPPKGRSV